MTTTSNWRDLIKIHPAADLFPMMAQDDLRVLGEDIKANGLLHPIQMLSGAVIDGRNRLDAMELVGLTLEFRKRDNQFESQIWVEGKVIGHCRHNTPIDIPDPAAFVVSHNIHRRHLTTAQKGELIAKLLKADPTKSDRAIAEVVKADHKTVGAKRAALSATGEIPQSDTGRVGADGKTRKPPTKKTDEELAARADAKAAKAAEYETVKEGVAEYKKAQAAMQERLTAEPDIGVAAEPDVAKAEELRKVYTGVSDKVGQVQKLYLELSDQEQTYFRRWLKSQLSAEQKTVDTAPTLVEVAPVGDEPDLGKTEIAPVEEPPVEEFVAASPAVAPDRDEEVLQKLGRTKWVWCQCGRGLVSARRRSSDWWPPAR